MTPFLNLTSMIVLGKVHVDPAGREEVLPTGYGTSTNSLHLKRFPSPLNLPKSMKTPNKRVVSLMWQSREFTPLSQQSDGRRLYLPPQTNA